MTILRAKVEGKIWNINPFLSHVRSKETVNFDSPFSRGIAVRAPITPITRHFIFKRASEKYVKICVAYIFRHKSRNYVTRECVSLFLFITRGINFYAKSIVRLFLVSILRRKEEGRERERNEKFNTLLVAKRFIEMRRYFSPPGINSTLHAPLPDRVELVDGAEGSLKVASEL